MDLKRIAEETAKMLRSYLTYQAVRTVADQLRETNPPLAIWFSHFSSKEKLQNGDAYLQELLQEKPDLALRIMTVREYLADRVVDFLPEMTRTGIHEANIDHRRQLLERLTQSQPTPVQSIPSEPEDVRSQDGNIPPADASHPEAAQPESEGGDPQG